MAPRLVRKRELVCFPFRGARRLHVVNCEDEGYLFAAGMPRALPEKLLGEPDLPGKLLPRL